MSFLREPEPQRGVALAAAPGVWRIVAANAGPMSYHGTNSYLIEGSSWIVLDPGPDDAAHVAALLAATGGRVSLILLSHGHRDHFGAVTAFQAATGAPVAAFRHSQVPDFVPDILLVDGDQIGGLTVLHTPGHASDQLCFGRPDGLLFTSDHVMGWASSVVSPPAGDMAAYCRSLDRLLVRPDRLYLPGHGPAIPDPHEHVRNLLARRISRERDIARVIALEPTTLAAIVDRLYVGAAPMLHRAASRNVHAHLIKLESEGAAYRNGDHWQAVS